jgi:hypothetical protein
MERNTYKTGDTWFDLVCEALDEKGVEPEENLLEDLEAMGVDTEALAQALRAKTQHTLDEFREEEVKKLRIEQERSVAMIRQMTAAFPLPPEERNSYSNALLGNGFNHRMMGRTVQCRNFAELSERDMESLLSKLHCIDLLESESVSAI